MISKNTFVMLMAAIEKQSAKDRENGKLITRMGDPDINNHEFIFTTPLIDATITALQMEMDDKNDSGWSDISYFIYELDFGKSFKLGAVKRADKSDVALFNAHQLYDWLLEQRNAGR